MYVVQCMELDENINKLAKIMWKNVSRSFCTTSVEKPSRSSSL